eukprot:MONOS_7616.1-p1 / transcript=MONOS_7616.1 / gene=MONOS_7616 / organism=Monocercomonoides_exilis_PA203 / gene_product=polyubiquitin / transcript_product=polyubiquitin / location=Mono_scaffold00265:16239-20772(-) / protein_length=1285 / sequence_SO=supercontig / SO=protein_coding / is_pseudo=false
MENSIINFNLRKPEEFGSSQFSSAFVEQQKSESHPFVFLRVPGSKSASNFISSTKNDNDISTMRDSSSLEKAIKYQQRPNTMNFSSNFTHPFSTYSVSLLLQPSDFNNNKNISHEQSQFFTSEGDELIRRDTKKLKYDPVPMEWDPKVELVKKWAAQDVKFENHLSDMSVLIQNEVIALDPNDLKSESDERKTIGILMPGEKIEKRRKELIKEQIKEAKQLWKQTSVWIRKPWIKYDEEIQMWDEAEKKVKEKEANFEEEKAGDTKATIEELKMHLVHSDENNMDDDEKAEYQRQIAKKERVLQREQLTKNIRPLRFTYLQVKDMPETEIVKSETWEDICKLAYAPEKEDSESAVQDSAECTTPKQVFHYSEQHLQSSFERISEASLADSCLLFSCPRPSFSTASQTHASDIQTHSSIYRQVMSHHSFDTSTKGKDCVQATGLLDLSFFLQPFNDLPQSQEGNDSLLEVKSFQILSYRMRQLYSDWNPKQSIKDEQEVLRRFSDPIVDLRKYKRLRKAGIDTERIIKETEARSYNFTTFKGELISMKLSTNDWMLGVKRGIADKYDMDARDLYFTYRQKLVPDDAKCDGEAVYLVKHNSSTGEEIISYESKLQHVEDNRSILLGGIKTFDVRVTICNNDLKGKIVVIHNVRSDMKVDEFAVRIFENLHIPAGRMTLASEIGSKFSGTWKCGYFELQETSEVTLVSKLTYYGQSWMSCCVYQLITDDCLPIHPSSSDSDLSSSSSSSSTPSSSLKLPIGKDGKEKEGIFQLHMLQIDNEQGKKVYVEGDGRMLVEELKKKIEMSIGIRADKMTLLGGGNKMNNDMQISSYGLKSEDRLYAYEKNDESYCIIIQTLDGKYLYITVNSEMTIEGLKKRIYEKDYTNPDYQRLIFNGKQLPDCYSLSDCNIVEGSTILLALRLCGGLERELFVKSIRGQTLRFSINAAETRVRDIKQMVAEKERIPVEHQRLVWGGKELMDERCLEEYSMEDRSTVHLLLKLMGGFNIRVMHLDGRAVNVEVDGAESVEDVKQKVMAVEGVDVSKMRLVSGGRWLKDCHVLEDFGIGTESTVHLLPISRGGMSGPGLAFVDVTKTDALVETSFSSSAPSWRVVEPGICIEGICKHEGCPAFNRNVICRWGMKQYDLHASSPFCPCCLKRMIPLKPGFFACSWRITSVKEDGTVTHMPWKKASHERYTTYDEKQAGIANFVLLLIEAMPYNNITNHPTLSFDVAVSEVCGICHEPQNRLIANVYGCGHAFHRNCGSDWEENIGKCPLCQMQMKQSPASTA